jgi:hypothetical protein
MSRLIVSGCSFTNYWHPTWAWFLSSAYTETYNYGQSGAGNEYIYHSIVDADTDLHLNKDDTVVIAWSGYYRFDRFNKCGSHQWWKTNGDWSHDPNFKTLEQFVNDEGWIRKSINYITATARYLKSKNIKYVFTSLYDLQEKNIQLDKKMHTDPYVVKLLTDIKNDNFIYPEGLQALVLKHREQDKTAMFGSHPNLSEHQLLASGIAATLGVTIDIHTDLQKYDTLINLTKNQAAFGKILPLLATKNYARILTIRSEGCLSATIEKYYPTTMQEYKKAVDLLLIK